METTKKYFQRFWTVFSVFLAVFATVIGGLAVVDGGGMISYYCTAANPFLGFYLQGYGLCPVYVTLGLIFTITLSIMLVVFLGAVVVDAGKITGVNLWHKAIYYLKRTKQAKFVFPHIIQKNEIYIIVHNDEFWLRAVEVYAYTAFADKYWNPVRGRIKWEKESDAKGEASISRKSHKLLHFATIDPERDVFTMRMVDGDVVFAKDEHTATFPVSIQGKMDFWGKPTKTILNASLDVVVDYKGRDNISVKVKRNF